MSSGYGRNNGGPPTSTANNNRKRNKKYGLNLYQLQKGPAAPPVPSIITNTSSKGEKISNGLLLLSKKPSTSGSGLLSGVKHGGIQESSGASNKQQTANDAFFAKAQGGLADGPDDGNNGREGKVPVVAWCNKMEKQQSQSNQEQASAELSLQNLTLQPSAASEVNEEGAALKYSEKTSPLILAPKGLISRHQSAEYAHDSQPNPDQTNSTPNERSQQDQQQQYMSKKAKERVGQVKKLTELESKRLEPMKVKDRHQKSQKEKQQCSDGPPMSIIIGKDAPQKPLRTRAPNAPSQIYLKNEVLQRSIILEPLGKPMKIMTHADTDGEEKRLYNPDHSFSSLVGGKPKTHEIIASNSVKSGKSEESSAADKDSRSSRGKASVGKGHSSIKAVAKKENSFPPSSVRMIDLDSFEDRGRGAGRTTEGPRMLFDPASGSLVAAPSGDTVQHHQQQHSPTEVKNGLKKSNAPKQPSFTKPTIPQKQRSPSNKSTMKIPRTRGVLYKKDDRGNYINTDECKPDCGYGQHSVPGGRIKNHTAYAKLVEHNEATQQKKWNNKLNADAPAFLGFQVQKDPAFLQQQNDFEVQQQRILEDAWASLEETGPSREEDCTEESEALNNSQPKSDNSTTRDEYAAALAISPTMIGLGFNKAEPFDLSQFAIEGDVPLPSNRFSSSRGGESRLLGSSTWGANTSRNTNFDATLGEIAGLSSWNFDPNATDFSPTPHNTTAATTTTNTNTNSNKVEQSTSNSNFINLNGWGSSGFDSLAFGGSNEDDSKAG